ncbi:RNA-binding domain-containing protein [Thomasclavelia spiroformis]|uniref:RNA-binding domain-containing protein n=1 Tax=Thomasclavelia spiroformis TaxID=29348 RepID=UPI00320BA070
MYNKVELREILTELLKSPENEYIEFKEAGNKYDMDKLGRYFSAVGNEATLHEKQYGWIIFGVKDKTHEVLGTSFCENEDFNKVKKQISDNTTDNVTFIEVYSFYFKDKRVIMFQIPAAIGTPINWKGYPYGRVGESIGPLEARKIEQIKLTANYDWTRKVIDNATLEDLDKEAIKVARQQFKVKHAGKQIANEIDDISDEEFLNKAKILINSKITKAAMLLLGRDDRDYLLSDYTPKITWKLYDENNVIDYEHFGIPFIINVEKVRAKIRNLRYRYMVGNDTLFPNEVDKYDNFTLRELINNAIVHQDYRVNGPINVMEYKDKLIISNQGRFIPKSVENVLKDGFSAPYYRNPFLANAMVNLNMIDTVGSGIRRVFNNQRARYFPMPDYDLSNRNSVIVTLYGKIINENYSRILYEKPDLDIDKVFLLDMVQKGKTVTKEQSNELRKDNLIEGRYPRIFISSDVAEIVGEKTDYMKNKGLDNKYYMDYILDYLKKFGYASRKDINNLIYPKLPDLLNNEEKNARVKYLLSKLRKEGKITNLGSDKNSEWHLKEII